MESLRFKNIAIDAYGEVQDFPPKSSFFVQDRYYLQIDDPIWFFMKLTCTISRVARLQTTIIPSSCTFGSANQNWNGIQVPYCWHSARQLTPLQPRHHILTGLRFRDRSRERKQNILNNISHYSQHALRCRESVVCQTRLSVISTHLCHHACESSTLI